MNEQQDIQAPENNSMKERFATYAGTSFSRWLELVGQQITYRNYGRGEVVNVRHSKIYDEDCLIIQFPDKRGVCRLSTFHKNNDVLDFSLNPLTQACLDAFERTYQRQIKEQHQARLLAEQVKRQREAAESEARLRVEREQQRHETAKRKDAEDRRQAVEAQQRAAEEQARQRALAIQQICQERQITTLFHFTQRVNLASILTVGLWPRLYLEQSGAPAFKWNDIERLDGCKDAVCFTIGWPNYSMLCSKRYNGSMDWVVLEVAIDIVWELPCAFCKTNAAANSVTGVPLAERRKSESLNALFDDFHVGYTSVQRNRLNIPSYFPTHPQAEVLVFDRVSHQHIRKVHFETSAGFNAFCDQYPQWRRNPKLERDNKYFRHRMDYHVWRDLEETG